MFAPSLDKSGRWWDRGKLIRLVIDLVRHNYHEALISGSMLFESMRILILDFRYWFVQNYSLVFLRHRSPDHLMRLLPSVCVVSFKLGTTNAYGLFLSQWILFTLFMKENNLNQHRSILNPDLLRVERDQICWGTNPL
jgi:hypothetical protein